MNNNIYKNMKTEYIEYYKVESAKWILSIKKCDLKKELNWDVYETDKNGSKYTWNGYYTQVKDLCHRIIKNDGEVKVSYKYANGRSAGREYTKTFGIQSLHHKLRGVLIDDEYRDFDQKNAHPTILKYLCDKSKLDCPLLTSYVENRAEVLAKNSITKKEVLVFVNSDICKSKKLFIQALHKELTPIKNKLIVLYGHDQDLSTLNNDNIISSSLNQLLCIYESKILNIGMRASSLDDRGVSKCFDGFQTQNSDLTIEHLNKATEKYGVTWDIKPKDTSFIVPYDFVAPDPETDISQEYFDYRDNFHKENFLCLKPAEFWRYDNSGGEWYSHSLKSFNLIYMNTPKFKDPFGDEESKKKSRFSDIWLQDVDRRTYENTDIIPYAKAPSECPITTFNKWVPYSRITAVTETYDPISGKGLEWFNTYGLPMIKAITGKDEDQAEWLLKFIAHMIQYPEVLPEVIIIIKGKEGVGKDALIDFIEALIGNPKLVCRTNNVDLVLGNFNSAVENKLIIQFNELSDKDSVKYKEQIKDLSTGTTVQCNRKGIDSYRVNNFARMFCFTNNSMGGCPGVDNRRQIHLVADDQFKGDTKHWNGFHAGLKDEEVMNSVFNLLWHTDVEDFNPKDFKKSDNLLNLMEGSIPPLYRYFYEIFSNVNEFPYSENEDGTERSCGKLDVLNHYKKWLKDHGEHNQCDWATSQKMTLKIKEIGGVKVNVRQKGRCDNKVCYVINTKLMIKHLDGNYFDNGLIKTEYTYMDLSGFKDGCLVGGED